MKRTTETEIRVSNGQITKAEVMPDGTCRLTIEMLSAVAEANDANIDDIIALVEASNLSMEDEFMKHIPKSDEEKNLKKLLTKAISSGNLKDFYRPKYDPSFDESGGICYAVGKKPAVGRSYNWWDSKAKEFNPNRKSRLGTKTEYIAFLGVLIKELVKKGWTVESAWYAVCTNSKELGHYWNSKNAKHNFENTGSREICAFYDLANMYKILAEDEEAGGFWLAGAAFNYVSYYLPLADLNHYCNRGGDYYYSVGWLVLEK